MSYDTRRQARLGRIKTSLTGRRRRERWFRRLGALATFIGISFLAVFLVSLLVRGGSAFLQTEIELTFELDQDLLAPEGEYRADRADFDSVVRNAILAQFPEVSARNEVRELMRIVSIGAVYDLRAHVDTNPDLIGENLTLRVPASALADRVHRRSSGSDIARSAASDRQRDWIQSLQARDRLSLGVNTQLFLNGDSREPELAGIRGALTGTLLILIITAALALPLGIAAAIYLEEFAESGRLKDLVEVNINNLAAVPSIIFGLLGLAVFIDVFGMPRSAPLVGGLVMTLLTLPIVIIAARGAITAVPRATREAALALGASRMQVVFDHVLPEALPGILTGAIFAMGRAIGETAPLLMIGMVAFIVDVPTGFTDPATAMPVQIYLWADSLEPAFAELTAAATIILLVILLLMNVAAVIMRNRLEARRRR